MEKEMGKCVHATTVPLDHTCIQCTKCKAVSYHRDFGNTGQPKERQWSKHVNLPEGSNDIPEGLFEMPRNPMEPFNDMMKKHFGI